MLDRFEADVIRIILFNICLISVEYISKVLVAGITDVVLNTW